MPHVTLRLGVMPMQCRGGYHASAKEERCLCAAKIRDAHVSDGSMLSKNSQIALRLISCRKTKHAMIARRDALRPVAEVTGEFMLYDAPPQL